MAKISDVVLYGIQSITNAIKRIGNLWQERAYCFSAMSATYNSDLAIESCSLHGFALERTVCAIFICFL